MIINFRIYRISQGARKLVRTSTLIYIKKRNEAHKQELTKKGKEKLHQAKTEVVMK
jgi:hypothetical protein